MSKPRPDAADLSTTDLLRGVRDRDRTILARALTLVESTRSDHRRQAEQLLDAVLPHAGGSIRIGVSGPPGVGKSTFIAKLGDSLLAAGRRPAVLAVDPSSTISGGSILGDKTRMQTLALSDDALVRPSPSSLHLGGVAPRTRESIVLCEAAGFDVVLVETVGTGQSEIEVADMVDSVLLLTLAGAGDELQSIKRGILERVHAVGVNKADGDNLAAARRACVQARQALQLTRSGDGEEPPIVHACSALTGEGIEILWQALTARHQQAAADGSLAALRAQQTLQWFRDQAGQLLHERFRREHAGGDLARDLEHQVATGRTTPGNAARRLVDHVLPAAPSDPES